jgi:hypothetical protein
VATDAAATTVGRRIGGRAASRPRALLTSLMAGAVVTVLAYRWLRSCD